MTEDIVLSPDLVLINEDVENSTEIIKKLGSLMFAGGHVKDTYIQAVIDREKVFPTGLQTVKCGFAIPHTDSIHVNQTAVAVATLKSPVVFKAMDNPENAIDVKIVMMLAVSDPNKVVETLTTIISILENGEKIDKILAANSKVEIFNAVHEHMKEIIAKRGGRKSDFQIAH
ncbi:MAG: PTS sugar transporter subunit IIA [Anaerolineaceae bacterium]|nr:PTS sugar transporter subunit IIA [Anaerolineaceae bacterium]